MLKKGIRVIIRRGNLIKETPLILSLLRLEVLVALRQLLGEMARGNLKYFNIWMKNSWSVKILRF